ncbi:hypothetical protein [Kingella kingae]|uniref:hypothetical protein n=1 Tax=Kingella kingae TaxID=504 RepID=UPI00041154C3|nr:hypothetical protein [Kingella kingae]
MKPRIYKIVYREDKSIYIFRTPRTEKEFQTYEEARAAFFYPALVAYNYNYFPQLVQNLQKANKPKMVIIAAIMRKLAKLCYCIHKSQKPFDKSRYQSKTA